MILLDNQTDYKIDLTLLNSIAKFLKVKKDIELIVTNNSTICKYNKEFRGINKATDVLSFPLEDIEFMPLGSIVISIEKAKEVAGKLNHSIDDELALLFTHGLLHLLGFDHEVDNGQMRKLESKVIKEFNLPKSLIVRTQGE